MITAEYFQLPMRFELTAVFLFGVTGALVAIEKRYDIVGVFVLALLSATGGGLLRDVLTGQETLLFRPGEFYVLAATFGIAVFFVLAQFTVLTTNQAAWASIAVTFLIRLASMTFNWRTRPAQPLFTRKAPS